MLAAPMMAGQQMGNGCLEGRLTADGVSAFKGGVTAGLVDDSEVRHG
jgi:hypothetical protein